MPSWVEGPGRLLRTLRNTVERYPHSKQGGDEYEEFHFGERKTAGSGRGGVSVSGEDVLWTAVNFRFLFCYPLLYYSTLKNEETDILELEETLLFFCYSESFHR